MPFLDPVRLALGLTVMGAAAAWDIRSRRVPDAPWIALGGAGLALLTAELLHEGQPPELLLVIAATALLFADIFWDRGPLARRRPLLALGAASFTYTAAGAMIATSGALLWGRFGWWTFLLLLAMPALILLAYGFYAVGLLPGGADAKALAAMALAVPRAPELGLLPLWRPLLLPFPLLALLYWGLLTLPLPLLFLALNALRGDLELPEALLGFRVSLADPPRHVWFMDRIEGGRLTRRWRAGLLLPPEEREWDAAGEADRLRAAGLERAWATPLTPGVAFFAAGFVLAFLLGNPLALL